MQKQRNTEGKARWLAYSHMYSYMTSAWKGQAGKKQRVKKRMIQKAVEKAQRRYNKVPWTCCCQILSANDLSIDLNLLWGNYCWPGMAGQDNQCPYPPKSYYLSLLFNYGSDSRSLEQLHTFPSSITSINSSPHPFIIPNQNLAQNSPLSGFLSFCRL